MVAGIMRLLDDLRVIPRTARLVFYTMMVAILSILVIYGVMEQQGANLPIIIPFLILCTVFGAVVYHATLRLGRWSTAFFFIVAFLLTLGVEWLGVETAIPFGRYHYTGLMGPKLGNAVPVAIPLFWFLMFYSCHAVALFLVRGEIEAGRKVGFVYRLLETLLASIAMVFWDMAADPVAVGFGAWVWEGLGPEEQYFGIPYTNFLGWFITSLVVIGIVQVWDSVIGFESRLEQTQWFKHLGVIGFFIIAFNHVFRALQFGYLGAAGYSGSGLSILAIAVVVSMRRRKSRPLRSHGNC